MTIGNVTTVRWLNTAVTLARIYLSVHGLDDDDTATLEAIILFIVTYYFPMYFFIKVLFLFNRKSHDSIIGNIHCQSCFL